MVEAPPKPSNLSLWMEKNGRPQRMEIMHYQTGTDTSETLVKFSSRWSHDPKDEWREIEASRGDFCYSAGLWSSVHEVYLVIDHAHLLDWTTMGRKRLEDYNVYIKKEARDIAEYKRLKAKFGHNV